MRGTDRGAGRRSSDQYAVPVCRLHHDAAHATGNDVEWFRQNGVRAVLMKAAALWTIWQMGADIQAAYDLLRHLDGDDE